MLDAREPVANELCWDRKRVAMTENEAGVGRDHRRTVVAIILAMETTSLADAKNRLSELVSAVSGTWERLTITKNGKPVAVLMAVEDLESLTETVEILSDPEAMAAIAEHRAGTGELTTGQQMAAIMAKRLGRGAT